MVLGLWSTAQLLFLIMVFGQFVFYLGCRPNLPLWCQFKSSLILQIVHLVKSCFSSRAMNLFNSYTEDHYYYISFVQLNNVIHFDTDCFDDFISLVRWFKLQI
ncbi:hypothetical protein ACB094_09G138700 [Castanea mollissima]